MFRPGSPVSSGAGDRGRRGERQHAFVGRHEQDRAGDGVQLDEDRRQGEEDAVRLSHCLDLACTNTAYFDWPLQA